MGDNENNNNMMDQEDLNAMGEYVDPEDVEEEITPEFNADDDASDMDENIPNAGEEEEEDGEQEDDAIVKFTRHTDAIYALQINPVDEDIVVSGGGDDRAFLWRLSDPEASMELGGHKDSVTDVGFSADGKLVATCGLDGLVKVWEVATGTLVADLDGPDEINWLTWHPRGNIILAGANDGSAWMWGAKGSMMNVFQGHSAPVSCGAFTPDGKTVVTGSEDGSLISWDPKTANKLFKISKTEDGRFHDGAITTLAIHSDSTLVLTGADDNKAILTHIGTGKILNVLEAHTASVEATGFSSVLQLAATGGMDGKLCIWDLSNMRLRHTLQHEDGVTKLQWHASEPLIYTICADKITRVWDARSGQLIKAFRGAKDVLFGLSVSRNGSTVLSGGDDGVVRAFRV